MCIHTAAGNLIVHCEMLLQLLYSIKFDAIMLCKFLDIF